MDKYTVLKKNLKKVYQIMDKEITDEKLDKNLTDLGVTKTGISNIKNRDDREKIYTEILALLENPGKAEEVMEMLLNFEGLLISFPHNRGGKKLTKRFRKSRFSKKSRKNKRKSKRFRK